METDKETFPSLQEWADANVGGLTADQVYGMHGPNDITRVDNLYDEAFARFEPLVDFGKRKFVGQYRNSAMSKEDLINHANLAQSQFIELLSIFTASLPGVHFSSGPENKCLIKSGDGLDFKLKYKDPTKITDMIRSTVVCHSISSLHSTVVKFIKYCCDAGIDDLTVVNFYDNVAKFGEIDRVNEKQLFGYVGIHLTIPLLVSNNDGSDKNNYTIMAEVQFHPSTIYDGTSTCLKERQVI